MAIEVDALIVGGGVTGLWLRSVLKAYDRRVVLIETDSLGAGQTIASQGIIHSGAKYAARADDVGELLHVLPVVAFAWRQHLAGENLPDLRNVERMTGGTWYWSPDGPLPPCLEKWWNEWRPGDRRDAPLPDFLRSDHADGRFHLGEVSLSPFSLLDVLAGDDRSDLLLMEPEGVGWTLSGPGTVDTVTLSRPDGGGDALRLRPQRVFLTAGAGNAALRESLGLPGESITQRRALRMGLIRGSLPHFCGHWFDAHGPRLTISTQFDTSGNPLWQIGGRLAENPTDDSSITFLARARGEVVASLPGLDLRGTEWSTYSATRAEPATAEGKMPSMSEIRCEGNVITTWPTKLTLLPELMIDIRRALDAAGDRRTPPIDLPDWPHPPVAQPPWETVTDWIPDADLARAD